MYARNMALSRACRARFQRLLLSNHNCSILQGVALRRFLRCTSTLVLAEKMQTDFNCIAAAKQLKLPVDLVVAGPVEPHLFDQYRRTVGVRRVLRCTDTSLTHLPADATASLLLHLQKKENAINICASSGSVGKDVLPRLGGLLDVQPVTDIVEVKEEGTFVRPIYAGNALQTLRSTKNPRVLTFRPAAFAPAASGAAECPLEEVAFQGNTQTEWIGETEQDPNNPQLGDAKIVVSGGRGIRSREDFERLLEPLRKKLGAALGATRAVVDLGFVPNDLQVGQTGKVVAPDLYIAVGISGAAQHVAGMSSSKLIVAVNKDPEAPIFKVSDYYLVGDIYKLTPELTDLLNQQ